MSRVAVARNYAETLLTLAERDGAEEAYGRELAGVAALLSEIPDFARFLRTPRVPIEAKREAVRAAFSGHAPEPFVRFLLVVLDKRRQDLLREMAAEYDRLLNERTGRVRATVTLAREPGAALRERVEAALGRVLDRDVVADFRRDPAILGGITIRIEDRLMDGSIRRRLHDMRRHLLSPSEHSEQRT